MGFGIYLLANLVVWGINLPYYPSALYAIILIAAGAIVYPWFLLKKAK